MGALLSRVETSPSYVGAELLSVGLLLGLPVLLAGLARSGVISRPAGALAAIAPLLVLAPEPLPCTGWAVIAIVLAVQGKRIVTSHN